MKKPFEKVVVVGLGYIGLPTAAILAGRGVCVTGVEINPEVVATINEGRVHIVEPDLDMVVRAAVGSGKLKAVLEPEPADAFIIAVPTPVRDGRKPDVSYIKAAAAALAPVLKRGDLIILESTSPVGTTEAMAGWIRAARPDLTIGAGPGASSPDVFVAYCPERVLPGQVLRELVDNDRVVGGLTPACAERAAELYRIFVMGEIFLSDSATAEMSKLTENAFRDVNIAFANELSVICDTLGLNVWKLIKLANRHPRVNILTPGPGVGGHCIAVDPWFIVDSAPDQAKLIRAAREINDAKPHYVVAKVMAQAERFKSPVVACLGLAFKANIDDLRESPAVEIVANLAGKGLPKLLVAEPHVSALPPELADLPGVSLVCETEAVKQADIVVLLVDHTQFKAIGRRRLQEKVVIDTRGLWL